MMNLYQSAINFSLQVFYHLRSKITFGYNLQWLEKRNDYYTDFESTKYTTNTWTVDLMEEIGYINKIK